MQPEWEIRRSKFNHDWLQNEFLNSLHAFLERVSQRKLNVCRLEEFVSVDFEKWRDREAEAHWLIESFDSEMSPKRFFASAPLSRCSEAARAWLPDLVHNLWLARYPVAALQAEGREVLGKLTKQSRELRQQIEARSWEDASFQMRIRRQFDTFCSGVERFSVILGSLREKVKVV